MTQHPPSSEHLPQAIQSLMGLVPSQNTCDSMPLASSARATSANATEVLPFSRGLPFTSRTFIVRPLSQIRVLPGGIIDAQEGGAGQWGRNVMEAKHDRARRTRGTSSSRSNGPATNREPVKNHACLRFNSASRVARQNSNLSTRQNAEHRQPATSPGQIKTQTRVLFGLAQPPASHITAE